MTDSKRSQERFVDEVNTLVESLERIENHAKALTANNLDLRTRLKRNEEEKIIWERRYRQVEFKEDSMMKQMEEAIIARTEALQLSMSRQAGDKDQQLRYMMDQIKVQQEEHFHLMQIVRSHEHDMTQVNAEKKRLTEILEDQKYQIFNLRMAAGPMAEILERKRKENDENLEKIVMLRQDLEHARNSANWDRGGLGSIKGAKTSMQVSASVPVSVCLCKRMSLFCMSLFWSLWVGGLISV